jgi:rubredoxin
MGRRIILSSNSPGKRGHAPLAGRGADSYARATIEPSSRRQGTKWGEKMKKWQCGVCSFVYDEAQGLPEAGIAPGTRWADIPDTWVCPDCGAPKSDFEMVEIE